MTEQNDWIEWNGGECPVPNGTLVDVRHRDGEVRTAQQAWGHKREIGFQADISHAGADFWRNDNYQKDIVSYRLCVTVPDETVAVAEDVIEDSKAAGFMFTAIHSGFWIHSALGTGDITHRLVKFAQLQRQRERKESSSRSSDVEQVVSDAVPNPVGFITSDGFPAIHEELQPQTMLYTAPPQSQSVREAYEKAAEICEKNPKCFITGAARHMVKDAILSIIESTIADDPQDNKVTMTRDDQAMEQAINCYHEGMSNND